MNILLHWSEVPEDDLYFLIPEEDMDDTLQDALRVANGHIGGLEEDEDEVSESLFMERCEAINAVYEYVDAHRDDALAVPFAIPSDTVFYHTGVLL